MNTKEQLIRHLEENTQVLNNCQIRKSFEKVDRVDFVDPNYREEAYEDYPLPIGFGQTISQPTTVAFMLELLDVQEGDNVLDVGSGSGWTTTLLALLARSGKVLGMEIIPVLAEKGKKNLAKYNFPNVKIECYDGKLIPSGNSKKFDKILVNATAEEIPENLIRILKPGGIMVIPIKQSLIKVSKKENGKIELTEYPGFVFVKLK